MPSSDTQFKRGQVANPEGRNPLPPELRGLRALKKEEVAIIIGKYTRLTMRKLKEALENPETPCLEKAIAKALQVAVHEGDITKINFILDRTIGKVTEKVEISTPKPYIIQRLDGTEIVLGSSLEDMKQIE